MKASRILVLGSLAVALPLGVTEAQGQRGQMRPRVIAPRTPSASELLDRRRALDLNPRQVARLDSIERVQFSQRRALGEQMRRQRDSLCANRNPCVLTPEERDRFRAQQQQMRPQREQMMRGDSLARTQAYAVLDSTQRNQLQTMREQRVMRQRAAFQRDRVQRGRVPRAGFRREGMRDFERGRLQRSPRFREFQSGPRSELRRPG